MGFIAPNGRMSIDTEFERKWSLPVLRLHPRISLVELRKTTTRFSQDGWYLDRVWNSRLPYLKC